MEIYRELKQISETILKSLDCHPEPIYPVRRTKQWVQGHPVGITYHYTGGSSGLNAIQWGNHIRTQNKESSWHVLILDRRSRSDSDRVGVLWEAHASPKIKEIFQVPTLLMASWFAGTWHGNWTCDKNIGVENRNGGYSLKLDVLKRLGKTPLPYGKRVYEPYTYEQILANITIGRMVSAFTHHQLKPNLILPHSAVWSIKNDPGPNFPIHHMRNAVLSDDSFSSMPWLLDYPQAAALDDLEETVPIEPEDNRMDAPYEWLHGDERKIVASDLQVAQLFRRMGYNVNPNNLDTKALKEAIYFFQSSTNGYKKVNRYDRVLKVDGIYGPKTADAVRIRLLELGKVI